MPRTTLSFVGFITAVIAFTYQLYIKPTLVVFGVGRVIESAGNQRCTIVPELQACEKTVLHQPSGVLYLACSTPISRTFWTPALDRLDASGRSETDYVATYDPRTSTITHLKLSGFKSVQGLSVHGMDVVPSASNPSELFVYLVNHRVPLKGSASQVGADSVIEIFKTTVGSSELEHVDTVEDPVIIAPNDVVGASDGRSFYFTNDNGSRVGITRKFGPFGYASTSVGYCHVDHGCKFAITKLHGCNGITKSRDNDTFYVANILSGQVRVLEMQSDNTLILTDVIALDRPVDNIAIDDNGAVWGAGVPKTFSQLKHFNNPSLHSPSSAIRITKNTGVDSFYGKKYKIDKVFEDEGGIASGSTSATYDSQRQRLFMHGLCSPHLSVCKI